jgi:hypothetical protein
MARSRAPLFLERQVYRRRRLMDAARMLPVLGLVALLLPALWSRDGETGTAAEAVYLFGLWALLILAAVLLSRPLRDAQDREAPPAVSPPVEIETGEHSDG